MIEEWELSRADAMRQREQARGLACSYAAALAKASELLADVRADAMLEALGPAAEEAFNAACAVASGGEVGVPLRTLIEWRLHAAGWESKVDTPFGDRWYPPDDSGWLRFDCAIAYQVEREEAGGGPAEAAT